MGASTDFTFNLNTAQRNLTTAIDDFSALGREIEAKFKYIKEREVMLEQRETQLIKDRVELSEREERCKQREIDFENRLCQREMEVENRCKQKEVELENTIRQQEHEIEERFKIVEVKENEWMKLTRKLEDNLVKVGDVVQLDVGGKTFKTSKKTLQRHQGSFFDALLKSEQFQQPTGSFIDRDPKYFRLLLNLLRDGEYQEYDIKKLSLEKFRQDCQFYNVPLPLGMGISLMPSMLNTLKGWLPGKKFHLIYKATKDGFSAADFHKNCDNHGPTLSIILSSNSYLFGGYAPESWDTSNTYKSNPESFLFTLSNPHYIAPTRFPFHTGRAMSCYAEWHITFGNDISICSNSNTKNSTFSFPTAFSDPTAKSHTVFTGTKTFTTQEIEVYAVVN